MSKKTDHEDKGCMGMTRFLGKPSKCQTCSLPKCADDRPPVWWDGLSVGNDIGLLDGMSQGARGAVNAISRYWEGNNDEPTKRCI